MEVVSDSGQVSGGADRGVGIDVVEARLNEVAGGLNVVYGRLVDVVVEFVSDPGLWEGRGLRSLEHYVCWKANVSRRVACQLTAVARRAGELPETLVALREGRITLDQADEVARWVPWWGDGQAARLAEVTTVSQLGRTLRRYPFGDYVKPEDLVDDDPEAKPDPEAEPDSAESAGAGAGDDTSLDDSPGSGLSGEREHCRFGYDERGRFFLHLLTDGLMGALIERALEEARDALFQSGQRDVTWVRALEEVVQRSLDTVESPSRRDRFMVSGSLDYLFPSSNSTMASLMASPTSM